MISFKQINENDIDLCYELDSNTISLWSKKQWANEFKKEGTKIFGLSLQNFVIGICVLQFVLDEAHINYFVVNQKYRNRGFGSYFMSYLIKKCKKTNTNRLLLEVSQNNLIAQKVNQTNIVELKLKTVKFKLDLKELSLFLETFNPKINYKDIFIPIQNLKVYIDFVPLIKSDFRNPDIKSSSSL